jgi:hypothetical protein
LLLSLLPVIYGSIGNVSYRIMSRLTCKVWKYWGVQFYDLVRPEDLVFTNRFEQEIFPQMVRMSGLETGDLVAKGK